MSLLDDIRAACAAACDDVLDVIPPSHDARISIVVSHPGTAEDSVWVGTHTLDELLAVVARMDRGGIAVGTIDPSGYTEEGVTPRRSVQ